MESQSGYDADDDDDDHHDGYDVEMRYMMHTRIHAYKIEIVHCHIGVDVFNHN